MNRWDIAPDRRKVSRETRAIELILKHKKPLILLESREFANH